MVHDTKGRNTGKKYATLIIVSPTSPTLSNWFRKSLSSRYACNSSYAHCKQSKKSDSLE